MAIGGNLTALKRWQKRANTDYKKTVLGFWFWLLGIVLFVVIWLLLMVFSLGFIIFLFKNRPKSCVNRIIK